MYHTHKQHQQHIRDLRQHWTGLCIFSFISGFMIGYVVKGLFS